MERIRGDFRPIEENENFMHNGAPTFVGSSMKLPMVITCRMISRVFSNSSRAL